MSETAKRTRKPVPMSVVIRQIATKNDEDPTKVGKRVRRYIRAHHDELAKGDWKALADKGRADGNGYPDMPPKLAVATVKRFTK